MQRPFFSTIIPAYNREKLIGKAIDSAAGQEFDDQEIIVVDDGSTDGTLNLLATYGDRIKVLRQENCGPGAARNLGIAHARGVYVAFLDSDDLWFPWTLSTYADTIVRCERPVMLAGALFYFSNENHLGDIRQDGFQCTVFDDYLTAAGKGVFVGSGQAVVQRDVLVRSGGFSTAPINAEDHDLAIRLGASGRFVQIHSPFLIAYRQHSSASTMDSFRTYRGVQYLLSQEKEGKYPGGSSRGLQRRSIIMRHARPVTLGLLKLGYCREAWELYRSTFAWHVQEGRWRYLVAFPALVAVSHLRFLRSDPQSETGCKRAG